MRAVREYAHQHLKPGEQGNIYAHAPVLWDIANGDVGRLMKDEDPRAQVSALTGSEVPPPADTTRPYDQPGGLRRPLLQHQEDLELLLPRNLDGSFQRMPDLLLPSGEVAPWVRAINDGGPQADPTRGQNCVDCTLSFRETWGHARARVAAPRTFDSYANGDVNRVLYGELDGTGRTEDVTGGRYQGLTGDLRNVPPDQARQAVQDAYDAIAKKLLDSGPGAHAFIVTDWAGQGAHQWMAVNQNGKILWVDPQIGLVQDTPPYHHSEKGGLPGDVVGVHAIVCGEDFAPSPLDGYPLSVYSNRPPTPEYLEAQQRTAQGQTGPQPPHQAGSRQPGEAEAPQPSGPLPGHAPGQYWPQQPWAPYPQHQQPVAQFPQQAGQPAPPLPQAAPYAGQPYAGQPAQPGPQQGPWAPQPQTGPRPHASAQPDPWGQGRPHLGQPDPRTQPWAQSGPQPWPPAPGPQQAGQPAPPLPQAAPYAGQPYAGQPAQPGPQHAYQQPGPHAQYGTQYAHQPGPPQHQAQPGPWQYGQQQHAQAGSYAYPAQPGPFHQGQSWQQARYGDPAPPGPYPPPRPMAWQDGQPHAPAQPDPYQGVPHQGQAGPQPYPPQLAPHQQHANWYAHPHQPPVAPQPGPPQYGQQSGPAPHAWQQPSRPHAPAPHQPGPTSYPQAGLHLAPPRHGAPPVEHRDPPRDGFDPRYTPPQGWDALYGLNQDGAQSSQWGSSGNWGSWTQQDAAQFAPTSGEGAPDGDNAQRRRLPDGWEEAPPGGWDNWLQKLSEDLERNNADPQEVQRTDAFGAAAVWFSMDEFREARSYCDSLRNLVFRRGRELLFRGDRRNPVEILGPPEYRGEGFRPLDGKMRQFDLGALVSGGMKTAYVSTSRDFDVAKDRALMQREGRRRDEAAAEDDEYTYVYVIDAPGGIDINQSLEGYEAQAYEQEIAFLGGVNVKWIVGAVRIDKNGKPTGWYPNPHYYGKKP
ncbi:toxin glutamine deamidase domain-containing protein [Carbonactinospora thermoautotrophica]